MDQTSQTATVESPDGDEKPLRARAARDGGDGGKARKTAYQAFGEAMRAVLDDNDASAARQSLMAALQADTMVKVGENLDGRGLYERWPDHRVRGWIGLKIYELVQGKATERVIISTPQGERQTLGPADLLRMVAADPDLARQILEQTVSSAKPVEAVQPQPVARLEAGK